MKIPNLPYQIDSLLYNSQRQEILNRIPQPIVCLFERSDSPAWELLNGLLTGANLVLDLSKSREVDFTVHRLLPGVHAIWIQDEYEETRSSEEDHGECILINATDLQLLQDGGMGGLALHHLFKSF